MTANKNNNVNDYLVKLKQYWEHINQIADDNFKFSNSMFKVIISSLLLSTWDIFTKPYVRGQIGINNKNIKYKITSQKLIRLIKEEYT
jgi:hypothetical protein